ncbi:lipopolysaccharide transport periplasmic protein LptA [Paraferrimonas sp. SM1919]|uniref:lipopolysaccharide transport periplasmic protein LptA n=1 Tax=Paraferrimonas sp. SM1919 TaxID=2662263 RepID=UPI0013D8A70F|nr:lipopolysaccharide transport periplasmic protein LptA [Paraferrimonas sp. SM1919]
MKHNKQLLILLIWAIFSSSSVVAATQDFLQQVKIAASKQRGDIKNNKVIFFGPVTITQGSIKLNADQVEAVNQEQSNNSILIATGKPATYSQTMENGTIATASANSIRYDLAAKTLTMSGDAQLSQDESQIKGEVITYNIETQEIQAEGNGNNDSQVITIIQPQQLSQEKQ